MNDVSTTILIFFIRLFSLLPFAMVQSIGKFLGATFIKFDKRTVDAIKLNLALCRPEMSEEERKQLAKTRLEHMGQTLLEMSHLWTKETHELLPYIKPHYDNSIFESEMKSEHGVILLCPHLGNWEIINFYLSQFRTPTFMYRPQKRSKKFDEFILESRKRVGSELAPANLKGVTQLIKSLKRGGVVGILPDQVPQDASGVYVPFYGQQAYTMTLATKLAQKTNSKVFMTGAYRVKGGFEILIEPIDQDFYDLDNEVSAAAMNRSIEKVVNRFPEQYQWEYKRFKKRADGKNIYSKRGD